MGHYGLGVLRDGDMNDAPAIMSDVRPDEA
jgi:hypothetical protein